jgi:hypothetical protein
MFARRIIIPLILLLVLVFACSPNPAPTEAGTPPPIDNSEPPEGNPTPSATFTPSLTETQSTSIVSALMDTNCRRGQGAGFEYLGGLLAGETAEVVALEPDGQYYYIANPDGPGYCWVWGEYLTVIGDTSLLPVYTRMPTLTPTPTLAFSYVFNEIVQCVSIFSIELRITNTGEVPLNSYQLHTVNISLGTENTYSDYRFADCEACGCGYVDYTITPGELGYLGSSTFMTHYPHGESFHTELMVCTEDGLGGQCLTQELNFTVP